MNAAARIDPPSWPLLLRAPHRIMFLAGAVQLLLTLAWWSLELAARAGWLAASVLPATPWPANWMHAGMMIYCVFPFFIFGFLMTAGPRWQGGQALGPVPVFATALPLIAGALGLHLALFEASLLPLAWGLVAAGLAAGLVAVARVAWRAHADRFVLQVAACALAVGALGAGLLAAAAFGAPGWLAPAALASGIWGFLLPIFVAVSHRMIPFFSSAVLPGYEVVRPRPALLLLLAAPLAHLALTLGGLHAWLWLADLPAALAALYLSRVWQLRRALAVRPVAMLHLAFVWLGFALLLSACDSLARAAGLSGLGLAPLHALTVGYFTGMLLAMATRVTIGHSGLSLPTDEAVWRAFLCLQAVAAMRVLAEFAGSALAALSLLAALGWLGCFGWWAWRHVPILWRPRADGRPG